jgi:hypothetical protein
VRRRIGENKLGVKLEQTIPILFSYTGHRINFRYARSRHRAVSGIADEPRENHAHMVARYTCWCNFVKMHRTVGMTPAMAANVTDRLWEMSELVALVDKYDAAQPRKKAGRKPKWISE